MIGEGPVQGPAERAPGAADPQPPHQEHTPTLGRHHSINCADTSAPGTPASSRGPTAGDAASGSRQVRAGDGRFSIACTDPLHFVLTGELDMCSAPDLTSALAGAGGSAGVLHLDLGDVRFCDLAAMRAILGLTLASGHQQHRARPVVLHHVPAQALRLLTLTGWDTLPGVSIDTTERPTRPQLRATFPGGRSRTCATSAQIRPS
jgi:ABC-type transporter Mla MlaB component